MEGVVVSGCTAGTVRVNMLANLEAALNIWANGVELVCLIIATCLVYSAFRLIFLNRGKKPVPVQRRFCCAGSCLAFGAAFPGLLNWVIAFMRDSALLN